MIPPFLGKSSMKNNVALFLVYYSFLSVLVKIMENGLYLFFSLTLIIILTKFM